MSIRTWRGHPLETTVVEILKKKDAMSDEDLLSSLKESGFSDVGFGELNRALLRLEVEGVVYVSSLARGKRRVELRKRKE
jgi:DNA-binding PadR family transcriptional regulator